MNPQIQNKVLILVVMANSLVLSTSMGLNHAKKMS